MPEYRNTVDTTTKQGAIAMVNALNAALSLNSYEHDTFTMVDIVQTAGKRSVSGDDCTNTYIILDDGTALFSQSDGIARSAAGIVDQLGDFIHEGLVATVSTTKMRNGNTIKTLKLIGATA